MILIEEFFVDGVKMKFYRGIDFNLLRNHSTRGIDGFMFCFIESWISEVKKWERNSVIDSLLFGNKIDKINTLDIDNNWISIYQTEGVEIDVIYNVVKEKVLSKNFANHPWISVSGIQKGAWNVVKTKVWN